MSELHSRMAKHRFLIMYYRWNCCDRVSEVILDATIEKEYKMPYMQVILRNKKNTGVLECLNTVLTILKTHLF